MTKHTDHSSRNSEDVSIDRLSNLPEPIICHILSFLPTIDAVKTTLLSKKFSKLWENITTLRFSHHANERDKLKKFVDFVNGVFSSLKTTSMHEFSVDIGFGGMIRYMLRDWVSVAVAKNVKRLVVVLNSLDTMKPWFELPSCIFTCKSLEVIELRNVIVKLNSSSSVCLPNLRILRLEDVKLKGNFDKLISHCSSLHALYLRLNRQGDANFDSLSVCSPTLERLTIISSEKNAVPRWRLKMDTPALKYLHLEETMIMNLSIETSSPLIEAEVSLGAASCEFRTIDNFIGALSNVKVMFLDVSDNWLEALGDSIVWPMFSNLTSLSLGNLSDQFDVVKDLLQKSPALETLDMKGTYSRGCSSFGESDIIPGYISPDLEMVKIDCFYGTIGQLEVLEYILLNASLLKRVKITTHRNSRTRTESFQEISKFPRKSRDCRIEFDERILPADV